MRQAVAGARPDIGLFQRREILGASAEDGDMLGVDEVDQRERTLCLIKSPRVRGL